MGEAELDAERNEEGEQRDELLWETKHQIKSWIIYNFYPQAHIIGCLFKAQPPRPGRVLVHTRKA